jgi:probable HAF family extracellular repeat protein
MIESSWLRGIALGASALFSGASWANTYMIVDLGGDIYVNQIGNRGYLVGTSVRKDHARGAEWRGGRWRMLQGATDALAVNARGVAGGYSYYLDCCSAMWPTLWTREGDPVLLSLPPGALQGQAVAVGTDGSSSGWFTGSQGGNVHCFRAGPDSIAIDLEFPGYVCYPAAMNDSGQVVGQATFKDDLPEAFLWQDGVFTNLGGLPGSGDTYAMGINDEGAVVGTSEYRDGAYYIGRPWYWKAGVMTEIGDAKHYASQIPWAINVRGQIVGQAATSPDLAPHAVRFKGLDKVVDLNDEVLNLEDWSLVVARSVNDEGVIAGWGRRQFGVVRAFVLIPQGQDDRVDTSFMDSVDQSSATNQR